MEALIKMHDVMMGERKTACCKEHPFIINDASVRSTHGRSSRVVITLGEI